MARLETPDPSSLTPEQRRIYDTIVKGPRKSIHGPFGAWLRSPQLADRAQHLGEFIRFNTSLGQRLSELAILVVARHWTAQYEWYAHSRMAADAGLPAPIIAAIREGKTPPFAAEDEAVVYAFAKEAMEKRSVGEANYNAAVALLGEQAVVELVGVLGYYCLVSLTLNIFDVGLPPGEKPPLLPLP